MYRDLYFSLIQIGGGEWIRTTESEANGFTVRPLWPTRELLQIKMELVGGLEPLTY